MKSGTKNRSSGNSISSSVARPKSGTQGTCEVLGLGVVAALIVVLHVLTKQDDELDRLRKVVGTYPPAATVEVQQGCRIVPLPVGPHAVAGDHQHGGALHGNRVPDVDAITMEWDRYRDVSRRDDVLEALRRS